VKTIVSIEWLVEEIDRDGDIIDVHHLDSYAEALEHARFCRAERDVKTSIGLVRDRGNDVEGLVDRQWAYVDHGKLPERFDWGGGEDGGAIVPAKYHREIET
jgi:hypothetical protein